MPKNSKLSTRSSVRPKMRRKRINPPFWQVYRSTSRVLMRINIKTLFSSRLSASMGQKSSTLFLKICSRKNWVISMTSKGQRSSTAMINISKPSSVTTTTLLLLVRYSKPLVSNSTAQFSHCLSTWWEATMTVISTGFLEPSWRYSWFNSWPKLKN